MTFASVPTLPKSSTLILDGFCPYIGRGIVFESDWGVGAVLALCATTRILQGT
jgi:hypothetical protein